MWLKSIHHQRLQFQHTPENTRVRMESFICDKTEGFWHPLKGGKFSLSVSTAFKKLDSFHPETSAFTYNAARLRKFICHRWTIAQHLLQNDTAALIAKQIHTNVDDNAYRCWARVWYVPKWNLDAYIASVTYPKMISELNNNAVFTKMVQWWPCKEKHIATESKKLHYLLQ